MDETVGMIQQGQPQISILGSSDFCAFSHYSLLEGVRFVL